MKHDLTGRSFGRWRALSAQRGHRSKRYETFWHCVCEPELGGCGARGLVPGWQLLGGGSLSCGCLRREAAAVATITHGATRGRSASPEFTAWLAMLGRCNNPNNNRFSYYGARGIRVCAEWANDFAAFLAHIGPRPSPQHSVDRINVNGNYEPGNVRWASRVEQCRNKRSNVVVEFRGERRCISEWAECTGLPYYTVQRRLSWGWPVDAALTLPVGARLKPLGLARRTEAA